MSWKHYAQKLIPPVAATLLIALCKLHLAVAVEGLSSNRRALQFDAGPAQSTSAVR